MIFDSSFNGKNPAYNLTNKKGAITWNPKDREKIYSDLEKIKGHQGLQAEESALEQPETQTPDNSVVSSKDVLSYLHNQSVYKIAVNNSTQKIREEYNATHMKKEDILAMGFTEEEIDKYFYSTQPRILNENGEYVLPNNVVDTFAVKKGMQINGRTVNSLDDLKYELFEAPVVELMNKVRAGAINQDQIIEELQKLGASNIEEKPIENDPLGRTTITYTYRGITNTFIPQNLTVVEEPKAEYDEHGEAFITVMDYRAYSRETLRSFGFTDSDLSAYFDKKSIDDIRQEGKMGAKIAGQVSSKDGYCYQLKSGIVINGYEVKTVAELYYFAVLAKLK